MNHSVDEHGLRSLSAAVLDSAPDAVVAVDERGRVVVFNEPAEALFGVERHEVVGSNMGELVPPAAMGLWAELKAIFSGGGARRFGGGRKLGTRGLLGSDIPVELWLSRSGGAISAWIQVRNRPAEAPESEIRGALLETAEELTQVGSWDWTPAKRRLLWSDNLFRIFGLEPSEIAPSPECVFAATHPDDRERVAREVEKLRVTGELHPLGYRIVRGGSVRHLQATLSVAEERGGRPYRMAGWVQDVTECHRADRLIAGHMAVAAALSAWRSLERGARRLLADLAEALDFVAGVFWVPAGDVLAARVMWHAGLVELPEFEAATRAAQLPRGIDLPGWVWERRAPVNLLSVIDVPGTARQRAADREGVRDAVAFPAISGDEVLAIVELVAHEEAEVTPRLVGSLTAIGYELGQFLARRRGELEPPPLTRRELEVLQLAAQGLSTRRAAEHLVISPGTVSTHLEHIYAKLGVPDKASAVATALRLGSIE